MKTIYTGGRVFTGKLPFTQAFAVSDGRFIAVGTDDELLAAREDGDVVVPLDGHFVCPGFIDSHMHLLNYGKAMTTCDLTKATDSIESMKAALSAFLDTHQPVEGGWLEGRGWNQDYFTDEARMPTRHDLDEITTDYPVMIVRCCGHAMVVNTRALEMLGFDGTQPQPDGGHYDVDDDGYPTGVFRDTAMSMVYTRVPAPTKQEIRQMLLTASESLNGYGVTSCHTDDLCAFENLPWQDVIEAYHELESEGKMTVRVYEQSQFTEIGSLRAFVEAGHVTGKGSDMFRIGPLKLLGDGSLGARTAFLSEDYHDAPGVRGLAIFTQEQFDELIGYAHQNGMQIAVHTIGDGILDSILESYEKAFIDHPRDDHRSGIVHVQITRQDQLDKMKSLSLHAYVQSIFIDYDARIVHDRVGQVRASTSYAFHTLRNMGLHVSNGTDCPVEFPDAMRGIQCAVTRTPVDGSVPAFRPEEAMSVEEAIRSYTVEGAHASFEENVKGQIRPGMLADFVILDGDPFTCSPGEIHSIKPVATYLGGSKVFG